MRTAASVCSYSKVVRSSTVMLYERPTTKLRVQQQLPKQFQNDQSAFKPGKWLCPS